MITETTSVDSPRYVGLFLRVIAQVIDIVLWCTIALPLLFAVYGREYFSSGASLAQGPVDLVVSWVLPTLLTIGFWYFKQATPGKMVVGARIRDAATGGDPSLQQCVIRYLGMFVSIVVAFLGIFWILIDGRKQSWHDKLARTVVVSTRRSRA